jgi:hypothetical protein
MSIVKEFASLLTGDLTVPAGLSEKTTLGLRLLARIAETCSHREEATRTFNIVRSIAVRDAKNGEDRAQWSWAWKGCSFVSSAGEVLARFERGADEPWCRSSDLLKAMVEHGTEDITMVLDPAPEA